MVRFHICERHSIGPALSRVERVHAPFHASRRKPRNQGLRVQECLIYGPARRLDDPRNASAPLLIGLGRLGANLVANATDAKVRSQLVAEILTGTLPAGLTIWLKYKSFAKAHHIVVSTNNAEAQPVWARREAPHQNAAFRQPFKPALRVLVPHQPEKYAAADKVKTGRRQECVERQSLRRKPKSRRREPSLIH